MRIEKTLAVVSLVLLAALVIQVRLGYYEKPNSKMFAMWKDVPKSVVAAKRLADEIVVAEVTGIRRADDLVIQAAGEPNNEDRIHVEVVTLKVVKNHKGSSQTIELFHLAGARLGDSRKEPSMSEAPPKPNDAVDRPRNQRPPSEEETSTYMLHDDPPYVPGEKYLLFVRKGPKVTIANNPVETHAIISPTTRFRVSKNNKLESMTASGFAGAFHGKAIRDLEQNIKQ